MTDERENRDPQQGAGGLPPRTEGDDAEGRGEEAIPLRKPDRGERDAPGGICKQRLLGFHTGFETLLQAHGEVAFGTDKRIRVLVRGDGWNCDVSIDFPVR